MPLISNEDAKARIKASPQDGGGAYCLSGIIMNGPGPERWCQWFVPPDLSLNPARAVEDEARLFMWQQQQNAKRGVLFVANVLQVIDGMLVAVDTYAVYADDPDRPEGMLDADRPWQPPRGFEGTEDRRPFPVLAGTPQVLQ